MRSPLSILLTFALTLALSLPGRAQAGEENCVNVDVAVEVTVSVQVAVVVNVVLDDDGNVNLDWQMDPEPDIAGFNIYRADTEGPYDQINHDLIQPQRDRASGSGDSYTFVDHKPGNGKGYYYMLERVDSNGKRKHQALVYVSNTGG